jgi:hypothetical protein
MVVVGAVIAALQFIMQDWTHFFASCFLLWLFTQWQPVSTTIVHHHHED